MTRIFLCLLLFVATALAGSCLFAADFAAWRGETLFFTCKNVNRGETIVDFKPTIEGLPKSFTARIGIARPVKFEREPNSGEFIVAWDKIEWDGGEAAFAPGAHRLVVCEIHVPRNAKSGVYKFKAGLKSHTLKVVNRVLPPPSEWKYYPDNQHSCRFLELRNGIQTAEKFRILKECASKELRDEMDALCAEYDYFAARKEKTDLKPLKEKTLELVNRDTLK